MLNNQRGSGLLLIIIVIATLFAILGLSLERSREVSIQVHKQNLQNAALNLAEAGVEYAIHKILHSDNDYEGEENIELETGTFSISVSRLTSSGKIEILSTGTVRGFGKLKNVVKRLKVIIQLSREDLESPLVILSREEVLG